MQQVPLNGRDFTQLIAVTPGFGGYSANGYGFLERNTRQTKSIGRSTASITTICGTTFRQSIKPAVAGIAGIVLPVDSIDEFFGAKRSRPPDTGRNPGGTVNLALKSGGNQIHGLSLLLQPKTKLIPQLRLF